MSPFTPPPGAQPGEGPLTDDRLRAAMADSDEALPWEVEWMAAELLALRTSPPVQERERIIYWRNDAFRAAAEIANRYAAVARDMGCDDGLLRNVAQDIAALHTDPPEQKEASIPQALDRLAAAERAITAISPGAGEDRLRARDAALLAVQGAVRSLQGAPRARYTDPPEQKEPSR